MPVRLAAIACALALLFPCLAWGQLDVAENATPDGFEAMAESAPLGQALQLVLVVAGGWDDPRATLYRFERGGVDGPWTMVGEPVECRAGDLGLAWGRGLHARNPGWGPQKIENDHRAPAGAFTLPRIFGRLAESRVSHTDAPMPYTELTPGTVCVTDPESAYYNEVVNPEVLPSADWNPAMALDLFTDSDPDDAWGVMVDHNRFPPTPGNDACVFLRAGDSMTGNDTLLDPDDARELALWLDYNANPVLVQLGRAEYELLARAWGLPSL